MALFELNFHKKDKSTVNCSKFIKLTLLLLKFWTIIRKERILLRFQNIQMMELCKIMSRDLKIPVFNLNKIKFNFSFSL
jgi:hypothetical protein